MALFVKQLRAGGGYAEKKVRSDTRQDMKYNKCMEGCMKAHFSKSMMFATALSGVAMLYATAAYAQQAGNGNETGVAKVQDAAIPSRNAEIGDIIVTAQKRSERLNDVPMSINAGSADQLKSLGITNTDDLGKLVPGFTFQTGNYGLPVYFIRGIGFNDTTLGVSPAVTVYVDQVPLAYSPMSRGAALDLERVEVLKGPQGTLFGQNSTGGAINYIVAKPTDHLAAGFDIGIGRFDSVDAEGFISGPVTDTLKMRLAIRKEYRGEWQRGYVNDDRIGKKDFVNGRATIDWSPSDGAHFSLTASGWRDRSDVQQAQLLLFRSSEPDPANRRPVPAEVSNFPTAPRDNRAASWDPDTSFAKNDSLYQFALRGDVDISDAISLTSITSYTAFKTDTPVDLDATTFPAQRVRTTGEINSFSQELRLSGAIGNSLRWMAGVNYQDDKVDEHWVLSPQISTAGHIGPFTYDYVGVDNLQKIKTKSVFGSLDYNLTNQLVLQGSVRYSDQDRSFAGCSRDGGAGDLSAAISLLSTLITQQPQSIPAGQCVTLNSQTGLVEPIVKDDLNENNLSWRASLNYKPNASTLFYANVTKGYKSGSFPTLPAAFTLSLSPVKQESVLAYEVGTKLDLFNRAVQFTAAAFYYDYRDKQLVGAAVTPPFGVLPLLVSIPKSRVQGVEVSIFARPFAGLTINAGATYVDTKVQKDPFSPTGPFGTQGSFVGNAFPFTPKWQGVFSADYKFALSSTFDVFLGASVTARSGTESALFTGGAATPLESLMKIKGYGLLDLRGGVETADGRIRLEVWGRNVTNAFYVSNVNRVSDYVYRFTGMPVTYGATLRYRFDR
ncbi:TonB-dependent receptor [Sphingobium sp. TomTYG45]